MILQPRAVEVAAIYGCPFMCVQAFHKWRKMVREVNNVERKVSVTGVASDPNCAK